MIVAIWIVVIGVLVYLAFNAVLFVVAILLGRSLDRRQEGSADLLDGEDVEGGVSFPMPDLGALLESGNVYLALYTQAQWDENEIERQPALPDSAYARKTVKWDAASGTVVPQSEGDRHALRDRR